MITTLSISCLSLGGLIGWQLTALNTDFLCSEPAVYVLGNDIEGEGIFISKGKQINLRHCEYAHRFSIELYSDKGTHSELFIPLHSTPDIDTSGAEQYEVSAKEF